MIDVTNGKLVDLAPTWRRYVGWSILHCPPRVTQDGLHLYDTAEESPGNQELYATLAAWFAANVERLPDGLAPLPPSTYHVTVCDGLSPMHLPKAAPDRAGLLQERLAVLPEGVADLDAVSLGNAALVEATVRAAADGLTYAVTGVTVRGTALLAELEPVPEHADRFASVTVERAALLAGLGRAVGGDLITAWRPHVTLAYAANRDIARRLAPAAAQLSGEAAAAVGQRRLQLVDADVFAFTDMATFLRR